MRKKGGLVYFIKPVGLDGPIKIGHSYCPANRVVDLGAWSPWPLELIGAIPAESKDERFLHSCFADCHSHREWFHSTPRLRAFIDAVLKAGTIDALREQLKPLGSIRKHPLKTENGTRRMSYRMRIYWAIRKIKAAPNERFTAPNDVSRIMDRWHGGYRSTGTPPTADEIAILDAFLAAPAASAVRHEIRLKVVA